MPLTDMYKRGNICKEILNC